MGSPANRPRLSLRLATPDDLKFVRHSWFESYRKGGCAPEVDFETYKRGQGQIIEHLATHDRVTVAAASVAPDEVCGWVCAEDNGAGLWSGIVHYVYVKQAYRRLGIAKDLVDGCLTFTHETRAGKRLFARIGSRFNPYLLLQLH